MSGCFSPASYLDFLWHWSQTGGTGVVYLSLKVIPSTLYTSEVFLWLLLLCSQTTRNEVCNVAYTNQRLWDTRPPQVFSLLQGHTHSISSSAEASEQVALSGLCSEVQFSVSY